MKNISITLYLSKNYTNKQHANIHPIAELPANRQAARQAAAQQTDYPPQFAALGTSLENWYVVDGEILKYVNGKKIS